MDELKENPILKFNDNQLQNVRKAVGYEDVNKLKQDIEQLQDWIQKQNHFTVTNFDVTYLERWLIVNKGSIERTKQKLDRLCTFTNLMPEYLQNFDIKNDFRALHNIANNVILPKASLDHYRTIVTDFNGVDDKDFDFLIYFKYFILIIHYMLHNDYCFGYQWVGDLRHITMGTVTKLNPISLQKCLNIATEALGQRIKRFHLISGSKFFDTVLTLIKQGMSAKLKDRIVIHRNVESLYEYIPREQLPKDYGGNEKSTKEINDEVFNEFCSDLNIERVKFMESLGTDESRRLSTEFNEEYSGMPGSFKTLCVD